MKRAFVLLLLVVVAACHDGPAAPDYGPATANARAFGIWTPSANDDCSAAQHDAYSVVGPDRKRYPTWHPPIDPATGCSFGHDHGRDPRGSALYHEVGAIPFGYVNEQLDIYDPLTPRHEDHFGHKVEWQNNMPMHFGSDAADALFDVRCDVLTKLHQGTHSKDAFTNNLHELVYHIRCSDGTEMHITMLAAIGTPGEFIRSIHNDAGPEVWYTDPFGRHGRTQPFPGSVRQRIARINNDRGGLELAGPTIGGERDYGGPRVHAPN